MTDAEKPSSTGSAAGRPQRKKRRHPALGSKIAAAGIGTSVTLGLVALLAVDSNQPPEPTPATPQSRPVVVVVHRVGSPDAIDSTVEAGSGAEPIELTVNPAVAGADASTSAVARTSGSR